jgi:hypothetical protein
LQNWTEQIFEIAAGGIITKLGGIDILNCNRFFLQNWERRYLKLL